jgi:hypothetical protein
MAITVKWKRKFWAWWDRRALSKTEPDVCTTRIKRYIVHGRNTPKLDHRPRRHWPTMFRGKRPEGSLIDMT